MLMQRNPESRWIGVLRVLGLIGTRPAVRGLTSGFRVLAEYDVSQLGAIQTHDQLWHPAFALFSNFCANV